MRIINVNTITQNIKDMCIKANHFLAEDMDQAMKHALDTEQSPLGRQILDQLQDNLKIAAEDMILSGYRYGSRISESWSGCTF